MNKREEHNGNIRANHCAELQHRTPHQAAIVPWLCLIAVGGPAAAVLLTTVVLGVDPDRLLRDPMAYLHQAFYIGFFSNIGVLGWWTAAVACLLAALVLRGRDPASQALTYGGALSVVLGLDDLLMIHEQVLPNYLGLSEEVAFTCYGLATLWYLWRFNSFHRTVEPGLLSTALVLFGISVALDVTHILQGPAGMLVEDGSKFTAICVWAAYHSLVAYRIMRRQVA